MNKFGIFMWDPKKHLHYWFYKFMLILSITNSQKKYWKVKLCNFVNKPFLEELHRCRSDFNHFKNNYIKIEVPEWEILSHKL